MGDQEYDLVLEDHEDHLYACVEADRISLHSAVEYVNRVMERTRARDHKKLLWVRRISSEMAGPQFRMVASVIVNLVPKDLQVAFVDRSPISHDVEKVNSDEAESKGRNIRVFHDVESAKAWLL
jgi:hypothetical protein